MITLLLIFITFIALGGGIYLFAIEHERNAQINAKISNHDVLRIAKEHSGRLSVGLLAQKTSLNFTDAERKLYLMLSEGVFHHEYDESYQPVFVLNKQIESKHSLADTETLPPIHYAEAAGMPSLPLQDGEVIRLAVECKGKLTASLLCMKANIQYDDAKVMLERLQRKGVFDVDVSDNGSLLYLLRDWEILQ